MYNTISLQQLAYFIIVLVGGGWLLSVGASIVLPLLFAILFALFLYPLDRWLYPKVKYRGLSITLSFLSVLLPLALVFALFSMQFVRIVDSLPSIKDSLESGLVKAIDQVQEVFPFLQLSIDSIAEGSMLKMLDGPFSILKEGFVSSTSVFVGLVITFIYTFFMLYYRKSFKNFIIYQFEKQNRGDIRETLSEIKETVQAYVGGLGLVILFLSILNSLGLWIIGIEYPIFWGALAGLLAVVPYVGTLVGGALPFLYALATADHSWQPIAVIVYYTVIQQLEGNVITPKIVGEKVDINPLVAIFSLLFFGAFWGVGGVILALPLISIIRILLSQFPSTMPISILMSSDIADDASAFSKWAKRRSIS